MVRTATATEDADRLRPLRVVRGHARSVRALAARSRRALDRSLTEDAELAVLVAEDEATVRGAFDHARAGALPLARASGGAPVLVGPGSIWVQLALARPDALVACDAERLLNRYVRPLLSALTRTSALAHYFGRDWVSASKRPVAYVGFAHDSGTGRALFEAIVAVTTPFAAPDAAGRASFRGQAPATLADVARHPPDLARVADAIVDAYASAYDRSVLVVADDARDADDGPAGADFPWSATAEEPMGQIGAGRDGAGRLRVGGELMASRDAMTALASALDVLDAAGRAADEGAVGAAVASALAPPATLFGVRALGTLQDVVVRAARA
jgi:hypothetical protein